MSIASIIYLLEVITNIDKVVAILIGVYIFFLVGCGFFWMITNDGYSKEEHARVNNVLAKVLGKFWIIAIAITVDIFIPSQQSVYMMLGANYLSNSALPTKVGTVIELKLDDVIAELRKEKK